MVKSLHAHGVRLVLLIALLVTSIVASQPRAAFGVTGLLDLSVLRDFPYSLPTTTETWTDGNEDLLVVGHGRTLQVYDVSSPSTLALLGEVPVESLIEYLDISNDGDLAAVSDRRDWITLIDLADRANPTVLGRFRNVDGGGLPLGAPYGMKFGPPGSDLLYVAQTGLGLVVVDISDASAPTRAGMVTVAGNNFVFDVEVLGSYAFLARGDNGIAAVDISDPSTPVFSSELTGQYATHLTLDGNRCYVASGGSGFRIVDLGVTGSPATFTSRGAPDMSTLPAGYGVIQRVELTAEGRAVAADSEFFNGLLIFDVSNPDSPSFEEGWSAEPLTSLSVLGDTAFTHPREREVDDPQLRSVDVGTGARSTGPVILDSLPLEDEALDTDLLNELAIVAYGTSGFRVFDLSDADDPADFASFRFTQRVLSTVLAGDAAILATAKNELDIVDLSDPSNPSLLTPYDMGGSSSNVVRRLERKGLGGLVYAPAQFSGVELIDFSDPESPLSVGVWEPPDNANVFRVAANLDRIAVSGTDPLGTATIWLIDFSNPALPVELGSLQRAAGIEDVDWEGDLLGVVSNGELFVYDVSNPAAPAEQSSFGVADLGGIFIESVEMRGSLAYLPAGVLYGVVVLGLIDPTDPFLLDIIDTPGSANRMTVSPTSRAVLADGHGGVFFWGRPEDSTIFADGFESGSVQAWSP